MKSNLFILCLIVTLGLFVEAPALAAKPTEAKSTREVVTDSSCMTACQSCAETCEKTMKYCLGRAGKHAETAHLRALQDCIATCRLSEDFLKRGSALTSATCALCAQACDNCAKSCDSFKDSPQMRACAQACRKCSNSCESMK